MSKCFVITDLSNEKSNRSGFGSDQGQIPGRGPRGAKVTDQKGILTDDFDRQSVNFENPEKAHVASSIGPLPRLFKL